MSTHPKVRTALEEAVRQAEQSDSLARKLIAWLDELTSGNSRLERGDDVARHIEQCLDAIEIEVVDADDD